MIARVWAVNKHLFSDPACFKNMSWMVGCICAENSSRKRKDIFSVLFIQICRMTLIHFVGFGFKPDVSQDIIKSVSKLIYRQSLCISYLSYQYELSGSSSMLICMRIRYVAVCSPQKSVASILSPPSRISGPLLVARIIVLRDSRLCFSNFVMLSST